MPNHITNILEFDCSKERSREIMEFVRVDDQEIGSIDFNKLIPMPKSLEIEAGSETDHGVEIFLTAVNPKTKDYGYAKIPANEFSELCLKLNKERAFSIYNVRMSDEEIQQYTKSQDFDYYFQKGATAVENMKQYDATNWFHWCIENWGTKWNAYDCVEMDPEDGYMTFLTAWSGVPQIVQKISEKFPDVPVHYSWADEDFGYNTGRLEFLAGEVRNQDIPEGGSYHAYEIACDVQGYDISEFDIHPEPEVIAAHQKSKSHDAR